MQLCSESDTGCNLISLYDTHSSSPDLTLKIAAGYFMALFATCKEFQAQALLLTNETTQLRAEPKSSSTMLEDKKKTF